MLAATASAISAWQQLKTNEAFLNATLKRATEIVNTAVAQAENYGVPRTATLELLSRAEGLFNDMALLGRPTPELKYRKAMMLVEFARNYAILGATDKRKARADEAYRLMTELANERPNDPDTLLTLATTLDEQGGVQVALGNLTNSLDAYGEALKIRQQLASSSPENIDWQRNLLFWYEKMGDVFTEQGDLPRARQFYRECLRISAEVFKANPQDYVAKRNLGVMFEKLADILSAPGDLPSRFGRLQNRPLDCSGVGQS